MLVLYDPDVEPDFPFTVWQQLPVTPGMCRQQLRQIYFVPQRRCELTTQALVSEDVVCVFPPADSSLKAQISRGTIGFISGPTDLKATRLIVTAGHVIVPKGIPAGAEQRIWLGTLSRGGRVQAELVELKAKTVDCDLAVLRAVISEDIMGTDWHPASLAQDCSSELQPVTWRGQDVGACWRYFLDQTGADTVVQINDLAGEDIYDMADKGPDLETLKKATYFVGNLRVKTPGGSEDDDAIINDVFVHLMFGEESVDGDSGGPLLAHTDEGLLVLGFLRGALSKDLGLGGQRQQGWRFRIFTPAWHSLLVNVPPNGFVHGSHLPSRGCVLL